MVRSQNKRRSSLFPSALARGRTTPGSARNRRTRPTQPEQSRGGSAVHTEAQSDGEIDHTRDEPLQSCSENCIAGRDFAWQIVIDRPAEAGCRNEQRTTRYSADVSGSHGKHDATRENRRHAGRNATVEVLAKQKPCK